MNDYFKNKNLPKAAVFSCFVLGFAFLGPVFGGSPAKPGFGLLIWGTAPAFVAVLLRFLTKDWKDSGFKLKFKETWGIWLLILAAVPLLMVLNVLSGIAFSGLSINEFSLFKYLGLYYLPLGFSWSLPYLRNLGGAVIWSPNLLHLV